MNPYAEVADKVPFIALTGVQAYLEDLVQAAGTEVQRARIRDILHVIGEKTNFQFAPASSRFHLNTPHGLFRHSVGVTYRLWALADAYGLFADYSIQSLTLVPLSHDLGKAGQVDVGGDFQVYYVGSPVKSRPGATKYARNKKMTAMSVPMASLYFIATQLPHLWIPSLDEWQAIAYHDGQYVAEGEWVAHSEKKLCLALHHADMWQSRVENKWRNDKDKGNGENGS